MDDICTLIFYELTDFSIDLLLLAGKFFNYNYANAFSAEPSVVLSSIWLLRPPLSRMTDAEYLSGSSTSNSDSLSSF